MKIKRIIALIISVIFSLLTLVGCNVRIGSGQGDTDTTVVPDRTVEEVMSGSVLEYPAKNDLFRYNVYSEYIAITEYVGVGEEVEVPTTIEDRPVYAIAENAFRETSVTKVIIPEGIVQIGANAFADCKELVSIDMPETLKSVGESCFIGCVKLISIVFPANVVSIPYAVCNGCTSLETVRIESNGIINSTVETDDEEDKFGYEDEDGDEDNVSMIGDVAFADCIALKAVYISQGITEISESAFSEEAVSLVIYGTKGSTAATFAAEHLIDFVVHEPAPTGE